MPLVIRRFVYSLLAAFGFLVMVPLVVSMRRIQAELLTDPLALESFLDPASASQLQGFMLLFLGGLIVATGFLYAALTAGSARSWRPQENGTAHCSRCGFELRFGVGRCPHCDQQLVW